MKIAGFSFVRNATKYDYPIEEAITSILPICDEFIIAVGNSDDDTLERIKSIKSDKIKIIETIWDDTLREGGKVLAIETDKAFKAISDDIDWCFYVQGDECVHEKYLENIKIQMEIHLNNPKVEGLLFNFKHFYGSYDFFADNRKWYRREIRVVRNRKDIHSYKDAQGFRYNDKKLKVKHIDAFVYHYGWVKPPKGLTNKMRNFKKMYLDDDSWIDANYPVASDFDYRNIDQLSKFTETHPAVMNKRINTSNWKFSFDPTKGNNKLPFKTKLLIRFEKMTGLRLFEYKNYKII